MQGVGSTARPVALALLLVASLFCSATAAAPGDAPNADAPTAAAANGATTSQQSRQIQGGWCPVQNECSFVDHMNGRHPRWLVSDDAANSDPFASWWSRDSVRWTSGSGHRLSLWIRRAWRSPLWLATGEVRTRSWYGYGCYEVRMRPIGQTGVISSFFTYMGPHNTAPGFRTGHKEIDVEFVWANQENRLALQCNYFTNGRGMHEKTILLPFEPEKAFHNYAFKWTRHSIQWFVDGRPVHTAWHSNEDPVPRVESGVNGGPQRIYMNTWVVDKLRAGWAGLFEWRHEKAAAYEAVRFTRGEECEINNWF